MIRNDYVLFFIVVVIVFFLLLLTDYVLRNHLTTMRTWAIINFHMRLCLSQVRIFTFFVLLLFFEK